MKNQKRGAAACAVWVACCMAGCAGTASAPPPRVPESQQPFEYPAPDSAVGEQLQPDEAVHARVLIAELESQIEKRYQRGQLLRDAHPKAHGCVTATFDVEPQLRPDLAQGVFRPGARYRALIRFSNGNPKVQSDDEGDGRGMAIKLYGVPGQKLFAEPGREKEHDFVLLSIPRFFINDVGKYLKLFRIYGHENKWEYVRIPFLLGWFSGFPVLREIHGMKVARLLEARYWSTLPYRLGLGTEAVKYSARPCSPGKSTIPKNPSPDFLRETMAATLKAESACMEFLAQPRGNANLSVEDVVTEWREQDAPFVRVAKITIERQEFDTPERNAACEDESYNPWRALPEHRPLGAINRVRRVVYQALSDFRHRHNLRDVIELDQGWDDGQRSRFYHNPQGSPIVPYDWFLALEQARGTERFAARDYLESFGLIHWDGYEDTALNPDRLPVGLTRDEDLRGKPWLGMNCGACHVAQMEVTAVKDGRPRRVLIDGGSSHFDFWTFIRELDAALHAAHDDPAKLDRLAGALDEDAPHLKTELAAIIARRDHWAKRNHADVLPGPGRVDALGVILNQVTAHMLAQPGNAKPANAPVSFPFVWDAPYLDCVQYNGAVANAGPGAVGRNVGQVLGVFGQALLDKNSLLGYPNSVRTRYILDLEKTMQTVRAPRWQELATRGVLPPLDADLVRRGGKVYGDRCVRCHVRIDNYERKLASIPVTLVLQTDIRTDAANTEGYFKSMALTGMAQGRKSGFIDGDPLGKEARSSDLLAHAITGVIVADAVRRPGPLTVFLVKVKLHDAWIWLKHKFGLASDAEVAAAQEAADADALPHTDADAAALSESLQRSGLRQDGPDVDRAKDCEQARAAPHYRARPLDGIWATAPYLHNGSVPSLAAMLGLDDRPGCFYAGSRQFDPEKVGFVSYVPARCEPNLDDQAKAGAGTLLIDTRLPGNLNKGHRMAEGLSAADRRALLEYLKSL